VTADGDTPEAASLRVVVAEDDVLLREGIAGLLTDAGCDVVAQAGDAEDLLRKGLAHRPNVVVADVRMPPQREDDGLLAAIELRRRVPDVGVLVLSQYCEESLAAELITNHPQGVGYLLKERVSDVASFIDAVRRVAAGGSALDPELVALMLKHRRPGEQLSELTPREQQVLAGMAEGKSNEGIADDLVLSQKAIEKHVTAIMHKLGIGPTRTGNRRVLAVLAYLRAHQQ
jgi:DNA-binding NarL/FixJ family response regulator